MILSTDYDALTEQLNESFNEAARLATADWVGRQLFDVFDTDWKTYNYLVLHGMGNLRRVAEGSELPTATSVEGDEATFTQKRYGEKIIVTKDMRMFDRTDQALELVRTVTEEAFDKIDTAMAEVLLNGFTGTSYTDPFGDVQSNLAPDGVVLFSASHTNNLNSTTARNLIRNSAGTANPALSRDAIIKARADALGFRDPNGVNRPIRLDTLIVSAANEDLAYRLVNSPNLPGGPDNDINRLGGLIRNIIVWPKLDQNFAGTDTSAYWFLADSRNIKRTLKAPFAQRPMLHPSAQKEDSLNWIYPLDAYFALGIGWPFAIWGSTGVNS